MADAVCRCGTYIRAYVPPGTQVTCFQCGEVLTMGQSPDENADGTSSSVKSSSRSKVRLAYRLKLAAALTTILLSAGTVWFWPQKSLTKKDTSASKTPAETSVTSPKNSIVELPEQAKWSNIQDWKVSADQISSGPQAQAMAEEILGHSSWLLPSGFLDPIDARSMTGAIAGINASELKQFSKTFGFESFTQRDNILGNHWSILAFHAEQKDIAVLVRYYQEPIDSELTQVGQWIRQCRTLMTISEFESIVPPSVFDTHQAQSPSTPSNLNPEPAPLYFTPAFGYLLLLFKVESEAVVWKDIMPLPCEVPLSLAVENLAKKTPDSIDIFGKYQASNGQSPSSLLYFGSPSDQSYSPTQIRSLIASIPPTRSRRLAEIAEAATTDTSLLSARMTRFRKDYPNDMGADALLISIWCTKRSSKRNNASYEDLGRLFVDAAHRLYMKTSDPILLEIKSRIYQSYGRLADADKSLREALQSNPNTIYMLEQRLTKAIDAKDKKQCVELLESFKNFVQQYTNSALNPLLIDRWKKNVEDWKSETLTE